MASLSKSEQQPKDDKRTSHKGSWLQVNNTLVPCVSREHLRHLPLSVLQFSAGLLTETNQLRHVTPKQATAGERMRLDQLCAEAGIQFPPFSKSTKLLSIEDLRTAFRQSALGKVFVKRICNKNPWQDIRYLPELDTKEKLATSVSSENTGDISHGGDPGLQVLSAQRTTFASNMLLPNLKRAEGTSTSTNGSAKLKKVNGICQTKQEGQQTRVATNPLPKGRPLTPSEKAASRVADIQIRLVRFYGKPVPCVVHNHDVYVAVETLHKIHFAHCISAEGFLKVLQATKNVPLVCLRQAVKMDLQQDEPVCSKQASLYVKLKDVAPYMRKLHCLLMSLAKKYSARPVGLRRVSSTGRSERARGLTSAVPNAGTRPSAEYSLLADDPCPIDVQPWGVPLDLSVKSSKPAMSVVGQQEKVRVLPPANEKPSETSDVFVSRYHNHGAKRRIEEVLSGRAESDGVKYADGEARRKKCRLEHTIFKIMQSRTS